MSTESFAIATDSYQGPLDTLLDLIEARKLSISDISLADVADSYLAYVEKLPHLPLKETSQFVLIASTLLLIKSRSLLPLLELTDDENESVHELEKRLARLKVVRDTARLLRKQWGTVPLLRMKVTPQAQTVFSPGETTVAHIYKAAMTLLSLLPKPELLARASVAPVLALEDVILGLKKRLSDTIRTRWSDITRNANRHDLIVHFLAILELVRSGSASATQDKLFGDIALELESTGVPQYGISS